MNRRGIISLVHKIDPKARFRRSDRGKKKHTHGKLWYMATTMLLVECHGKTITFESPADLNSGLFAEASDDVAFAVWGKVSGWIGPNRFIIIGNPAGQGGKVKTPARPLIAVRWDHKNHGWEDIQPPDSFLQTHNFHIMDITPYSHQPAPIALTAAS